MRPSERAWPWEDFQHLGNSFNETWRVVFVALLGTHVLVGSFTLITIIVNPIRSWIWVSHVALTLWMWFVGAWLRRQEGLLNLRLEATQEIPPDVALHMRFLRRIGSAVIAGVLGGMILEALFLFR